MPSKETPLSPYRRAFRSLSSGLKASDAVKKAISEAASNPSINKNILSGVKSTVVLSPQSKDSIGALARASNPITFTTKKSGALATPDPVGTARHEVAHLLGAGHLSMRAVSPQSGGNLGGLTKKGLIKAPRIQQQSLGEKIKRVRRFQDVRAGSQSSRPKSIITSVLKPITRTSFTGFQTPKLVKTAKTGTPEQARKARKRMVQLGQRMKSAGIDF